MSGKLDDEVMITNMNAKNYYSELVFQARRGERHSLGRLAELVQGRLYSYFYRVTLDGDLSDDLLQETLLSMVENISHLRDVDRFWPWLFRIAWSKTQEHYRNQGRRPTVSFSALDQGQPFVSQSQTNKLNILDMVVRRETLKYVARSIGQLKGQYREVVCLRCFAQLPYSKIAPILACTEPQARSKYFRARRYLRQLSLREYS